MSRWTRLIPGIAIAALLAACGENAGDTLLAPAKPAQSGYILGGNRAAPSDSTQTTNTASTSEPVEGDSARAGGYIIGGN